MSAWVWRARAEAAHWRVDTDSRSQDAPGVQPCTPGTPSAITVTTATANSSAASWFPAPILPAGTEALAYLAALESAINAVLAKRCAVVVVSLGVDTFEKDPISKFRLTSRDYLEIGRRLKRLGVPLLFVFEGGYSTHEVGLNAVNVLIGFERG